MLRYPSSFRVIRNFPNHVLETIEIQLNPAIAHFKGLVKVMLYTKVFTIASI